MGQRILMGILLSSGTISITQTVYYDQRCYMFYIGEGIINTVKTKSEKHLTNKTSPTTRSWELLSLQSG